MYKKILLVTIAILMVITSGCGVLGGKKNKDPMASPIKEASIELKDEAATRMAKALSEGSDLTEEEKGKLKEQILSDIEEGANQEADVTFNNLWDLINNHKDDYLASVRNLDDTEKEVVENTENKNENEENTDVVSTEPEKASEDAEKIAQMIKEKKITTSEELEKMLEDSNASDHEKAMLRNYLENVDLYEAEEADFEEPEKKKPTENTEDEVEEIDFDEDNGGKKLALGQHPFLDNVGRILAKIYRGDIKTAEELQSYGLNESIYNVYLEKMNDLAESGEYNEDTVLSGVYIVGESPRKYSVQLKGNNNLNVEVRFKEENGVVSYFSISSLSMETNEYVK